MNKAIKQFFVFMCGLLAGALCADAQQAGPTEYQVKAAFIYNFVKFIEWPAGNGALQVCIIGDDHFGRDIEGIDGRTAGGKTLSVSRIRSVQGIKNCQVMFISSSESERLEGIIAAARRSNVLTVGDTSGYAERGVIMNFYMEQNKVRFEINKEAAERSGLKISSKLFSLARVVQYGRRGGGD